MVDTPLELNYVTFTDIIRPPPWIQVTKIEVAGTNLLIDSTGLSTWTTVSLEWTADATANPIVWTPLNPTGNVFNGGIDDSTFSMPAFGASDYAAIRMVKSRP